MTQGLTRSETFVAWLCKRAFLKLWTHPNPKGKKGKEFCDCLIVCGAHVIIISVKEIEYRDTDSKIGWERWHKKAVEHSAQQIWGAERWLHAADRVLRRDGREIALPPLPERKYHRLSVSLGSRREVPLTWGDFGNGFVHVLDEYSLAETFRELDTITDLVTYLSSVESLSDSGIRPMLSGAGVEDLLGLYVRNGPTFGLIDRNDQRDKTAIIEGGIWRALVTSAEYAERNAGLKSSYAWDNLIGHYANDEVSRGRCDP